MASSSLLYFLLFLLLISEPRGIRLDKGVKSSLLKKSHGQESSSTRTRKHSNLARFTTISTLAVPKSEKKDEDKGVKSKATSRAAKGGGGNEKVKDGSPKPRMDVAGITEMDYSPARRKTPIHN